MRYSTLFVLMGLCFLPGFAQAASLYMDPAAAQLYRGDAITVAVRLDTDEAAGECVNAVDGIITYDSNITPVDVSLGASIFPVWVEQPVIDKENRRITFAGGIPNGYCGRIEGDPRLTNTLFEIVFRAPGLQIGGSTSSAATVGFAPETTAYLNDGLGTPANLQTLGTTFDLATTIGSEIKDEWSAEVGADDIEPEAFSISLERDTDGLVFEGDYYIVFNTTDKQTGISHYEVIEESLEEAGMFGFGAATAPWERTRSPHVLKDQSLRSVIRVRAVDKAGNEYVATLQPEEAGKTIPWLWVGVAGAGLLVLLGAAIIVWLAYRRYRRLVSARAIADKDGHDDLIIPSA